VIRNETEYQEAFARLTQERQRLSEHRARLREAGLSAEEIKRVIDPMESFHLQLHEEVESYERLKRGEFAELDNLRGLGHLLIECASRRACLNGNWHGDWVFTNHKSHATNATNISGLPLNVRLRFWTR
jgi:hypothetical protein